MHAKQATLLYALTFLLFYVGACDTSRYKTESDNIRLSSDAITSSQLEQTQAALRHLLDAFERVNAWPGQAVPFPWSDPVHYSETNWNTLVSSAKILQQNDPKIVEQALENFQKTHQSVSDDSKLFLILRVAFDLPESVSPGAILRFGGWLDASGSGNMETNAAWPISWNTSSPKLVAGFTLFEGSRYDARLEYQYFLKKYAMRNLPWFLSGS